jgi:hypothetical protein
MTDIETIAILAGLITPVYIALFEIWRNIGTFQRLCTEVDTLRSDVNDIKRIRQYM